MKKIFVPKIIASAAVALLCARGVARRFGASLGGVFCAICVLWPSPAEAQCSRWDVSGDWRIQQGTLVVNVHLRQRGNTITGTATYRRRAIINNVARMKRLNGGVSGTVDLNNITLDMDWDDGSGGIYRGVIGATGMIKGTVIIDKNNPSKTHPWHSMQPMTCADAGAKPISAAPPPAASPKRVISQKGKGPTDASAPAGVPKIVVFNKPGQAPGTQPPRGTAGRTIRMQRFGSRWMVAPRRSS